MANRTLTNAFKGVLQKPCWNVRVGHGSFLTLEFGTPHIEIREPIAASSSSSKKVRELLARRTITVHGQWHLWLMYCDWEVERKNKRMGASSTKASAIRAADFLVGRKLIGVSIAPDTAETIFKFEPGVLLKTRPYDARGEQWLLFGPRKKVLTVRADGQYSNTRSDVPIKPSAWSSV